MTTRLSGIALAGLIAALGGMACGSDDGDSGKKASPSKENDKNTEGQVECGPTICKPKEGFMGQLCCRSEFDGKCGQMVAGACTELPPEADKRCESATFMAGGSPMNVPSCCTADNECGLVFSIVSTMCTSLTTLRSGRGLGGAMPMMVNFNFPEPKTCDGDPIEVPAGAAGSGAAGSGM